MNLDHDLVREILLQIEEKDEHLGNWLKIEVGGHSTREINYHLCKLAEGGLIDGTDDDRMSPGPDGREFWPRELTFTGHDYLSAVHSDTIWQQVKSRVGSELTSVTFDVVKAVAVSVVSSRFGIGD